jgi:hypothetical protein
MYRKQGRRKFCSFLRGPYGIVVKVMQSCSHAVVQSYFLRGMRSVVWRLRLAWALEKEIATKSTPYPRQRGKSALGKDFKTKTLAPMKPHPGKHPASWLWELVARG